MIDPRLEPGAFVEHTKTEGRIRGRVKRVLAEIEISGVTGPASNQTYDTANLRVVDEDVETLRHANDVLQRAVAKMSGVEIAAMLVESTNEIGELRRKLTEAFDSEVRNGHTAFTQIQELKARIDHLEGGILRGDHADP